jgi:hypothetical protein
MREGRFARTGTICLGAFVLWMVAGRALLFRAGSRPPLLLVGSAMVRDTLDLWGYAAGAFRLALSWLWVAVGLWAVTAGFRSGPRWLPPVRLAIGLAGLAAVGPPLVAMVVAAVNVALLLLLVALAVLLVMAVLLWFLMWPLRRW